jgi:hypothetical protein
METMKNSLLETPKQFTKVTAVHELDDVSTDVSIKFPTTEQTEVTGFEIDSKPDPSSKELLPNNDDSYATDQKTAKVEQQASCNGVNLSPPHQEFFSQQNLIPRKELLETIKQLSDRVKQVELLQAQQQEEEEEEEDDEDDDEATLGDAVGVIVELSQRVSSISDTIRNSINPSISKILGRLHALEEQICKLAPTTRVQEQKTTTDHHPFTKDNLVEKRAEKTITLRENGISETSKYLNSQQKKLENQQNSDSEEEEKQNPSSTKKRCNFF